MFTDFKLMKRFKNMSTNQQTS